MVALELQVRTRDSLNVLRWGDRQPARRQELWGATGPGQAEELRPNLAAQHLREQRHALPAEALPLPAPDVHRAQGVERRLADHERGAPDAAEIVESAARALKKLPR